MPNSSTVIPLAPIEVSTDPVCERLRRHSRAVEFVLAGIVLVFVFLLASFAVRNADFWLHLATGRLIANGSYHFGVDPFAANTSGVRWVNHSWLFDWLLYAGHRALGNGIVIVKALFVAAVAIVMMGVRRGGQGFLLPAIFTALALLTASPRLLLQPVLVSLLFLALTILLLTQRDRRKDWLLPVLFVLWVNLDAWFLLGPLATLIFAVFDRTSADRRRLFIVFWVGVAACSLNPHHIFAFQLPPELSPAVQTSPLLEDARFRRPFESPFGRTLDAVWRLITQQRVAAEINVAGLSYFVLLALGIASFVLRRSAWFDWRLPLWLIFAALGAYQLRLVPFFAVVAGPITAMNFSDIVAARPAPPSMTHLEFRLRRRLLLRYGAILTMLVLTAISWPGWLQAMPFELRHCEWAVREEPTLRQTAQTLAGWYDRGDLSPDARIFVTHPEVGPYLAWYCPKAKTTIDPRLSLFAEPKHAKEFVAICRALNPELRRDLPKEERSADGLALLNQRKPSLLILYDPDATRSGAAFGGPVVNDPDRWPQFLISGKAIIAIHRDLADAGFSLKRMGLDIESQAFAPKVPLDSNFVVPAPPNIKEQYARKPSERTADADAATLYLRCFDELAQRRQELVEGNPLAAAVALVPLAGAQRAGLGGVLDVSLHLMEFGLFVPFVDPGPPEVAILAVRAARRAVAQDPNDANAWLRLGQAYLSLRLRTREGAWARELPILNQLRHAQIATALENAVKLNPDLILAHRLLSNLYAEHQFYDLALEHRQKEVDLTRAAGPAPNEKIDEFSAKLEAADKRLREMEKQVQERLNKYIIKAGNMGSKPLDQAQVALEQGLVRKALDDVLLKSEVRLFGNAGAQIQLNLLLMTGRCERVRAMLADPDVQEHREQFDFVGVPTVHSGAYPSEYRMLAYDWFTALSAAAGGDYDQADRSLRAIDQRTQIDADEEAGKVRHRLAILLAAEIGAFARPEIFIYQMRIRENRQNYEVLLRSFELAKLLRADILAVAGLLALERGDIATARQHFRQSLALAGDASGGARNYAGRPIVENMLPRIGR